MQNVMNNAATKPFIIIPAAQPAKVAITKPISAPSSVFFGDTGDNGDLPNNLPPKYAPTSAKTTVIINQMIAFTPKSI